MKNQIWSSEAKENVETLAAALDLPEFTDVEKYLWSEETPTLAAGEPDILTEVLSYPDVTEIRKQHDASLIFSQEEFHPAPPSPYQGEREADLAVIESNIEIAVNPPAPPFTRGEDAKVPLLQKFPFSTPLTQRGVGGLSLKADQTDQSDFLVRWRQKKNQPEEVSSISASRKFWGRDKNDVTDRRRVKLALLATRQWAGFLSAGFLIYLVIFGMSLAGQGLLAKENILSSALSAYKSMLAAKDSASSLDFSAASSISKSA